jgi:DNA polymerase III subunit delta'
MNYPIYFDSKKSLHLFELNDEFDFLINLYIKNKLPNVLMLSGQKGLGKSTLINHLLFYIFDKNNYDVKNYHFDNKSSFYNHFLSNIFSNIIYLSGSDFKNIKIEDIRILKSKILKTTILNKPRFIIFDDVELFNNNSLNALLKILEEPSKNNHFVLINNLSNPLIDTIKSRCLEIKIILNEKKKQNIIKFLVENYKIQLAIDPQSSYLTPGNFIKFNYILKEFDISIDQDFLKNLGILLTLYKKEKNIIFIDLIFFLTDKYFNNIKIKNLFTNEKIIECKKFIFENVNNYIIYNLNQNSLLNTINNKINE